MNQIKEIVKKSLITYGYAALGGLIVALVVNVAVGLYLLIAG